MPRQVLTKPLALLFALACTSASSVCQGLRLRDQSDWWSFNNEKEPGMHNMKLLEKPFDRDNLKILGLSLDTAGFEEVAARLGKARIADRGNASYSRSQVCYVSERDSNKVYLVFEGGEGGSSTVYLFRSSRDWKGSNLCAPSTLVSSDLATTTGLKLGLNRDEVEAILGKADFVEGSRIGYCREFKRRTTKEEFEKLSGGSPPISEKRAHELYDFIPDTMQAEVRFTDGRTSYLYISTTQIID